MHSSFIAVQSWSKVYVHRKDEDLPDNVVGLDWGNLEIQGKMLLAGPKPQRPHS